jgi:DNA-binding transcriptional MerR regulator
LEAAKKTTVIPADQASDTQASFAAASPSKLAGLVGISTRAIRHYRRIGLLAEPARKANGYREYSLRDAVELARVRRLTELGLTLDEVGDALADDAGRDLALLETMPPARDAGWLSELTQVLTSDREAAERAYAVYARLDELAALPADDPRVEETARALAVELARPVTFTRPLGKQARARVFRFYAADPATAVAALRARVPETAPPRSRSRPTSAMPPPSSSS